MTRFTLPDSNEPYNSHAVYQPDPTSVDMRFYLRRDAGQLRLGRSREEAIEAARDRQFQYRPGCKGWTHWEQVQQELHDLYERERLSSLPSLKEKLS